MVAIFPSRKPVRGSSSSGAAASYPRAVEGPFGPESLKGTRGSMVCTQYKVNRLTRCSPYREGEAPRLTEHTLLRAEASTKRPILSNPTSRPWRGCLLWASSG
jgi:hypothetical protein